MNKKMQGSLEYLIIIAAVLAIAAIVVLFMTGAFKSSSTTAKISACKTEAARCANTLATTDTGYYIDLDGDGVEETEVCNPVEQPGNPCYDACTENGRDILVKDSTELYGFYYCILGQPKEIYERQAPPQGGPVPNPGTVS